MFGGISSKDYLWRIAQSYIIVLLIIGLSVAKIIAVDTCIPEWCFVGVGCVLLVWYTVDLIKIIVRIRKEHGMALPIVSTNEYSDYN